MEGKEEREGFCLLLAVLPAEAGAMCLRAAEALGAPAAAGTVPAAAAGEQTSGFPLGVSSTPAGRWGCSRAVGYSPQDRRSFLVEG